MKTFSLFLKTALILLFWLLVWQVASVLVSNSIIIVSPRVAFARLFLLAQQADFWRAIFTSMGRILQGFGLAMITGIVIAIIAAKVKLFYMLILPAINVMNAVPLASFVVLALFAMGAANLSVFVPFVMVVPIVFHNMHKGIMNTDPQLLEMAQVFRVPFWKKLTYIYVKTTLPYLLAAAQVGIGFAWKSGIAAELIGQARGTIGGNLHIARIHLETADLFAWTIAIVLLSYAMERGLRLLIGGEKHGN